MERITRRPIQWRLVTSSVATLMLGMLAFLPARAETAAPSPMQGQSAPSGVPNQKPIPDQKIGAAATAMEHVASLRQNYQQQLAAAPESERQKIADKANVELEKAVTEQGLSVQEYNSILTAAQSDPKLRDQLIQHMHQTGP